MLQIAPPERPATKEDLWREELGSRRGAVWQQLLLGGVSLEAKSPAEVYGNLSETPSSYDAAILRDIARTLPKEALFREKGGEGQMALFRCLRAIATRLWDIGYCQSLNFIVATLIGIFPHDETTSFHCALALLLRYSLVDLYKPKFPRLGVTVWQFDRVVEGFLPKVHAVLQKHGVSAEYYALQWFLTLFASDLCQPVVRRIWDRFLIKGWQVVVRVGLALLYRIQDDLPQLDMCKALSYLKRFVREANPDPEELLACADSFEVTHRMLSALEAAYDWEGEIQLFVLKDLNSGEVHWAVQSLPPDPKAKPPEPANEDEPPPVPRAFHRPSSLAAGGAAPPDPEESPGGTQGEVLPFLVHDLDTGRTSVMDGAFAEFRGEQATAAASRPYTPDAAHGRSTFSAQSASCQALQAVQRLNLGT